MSEELSHVIDTGITLITSKGADGLLVDRIQAFADRAANVDMIKDNVEHLVERDGFASLAHVLDGTGYSNNMTRATSGELSAAIVALLPILSLDRILHIAEVSNFEVARSHRTRVNLADDFDSEWAQVGAKLRAANPDVYGRVVALIEAYASREVTAPGDFEALHASMTSLRAEAVAS